ncbi:MAG: CYTH and CHAD domain-containing protein [Rubrivivax sp.]|nr:CYTH and CHAD domain-containing protein [Rubrivivax sp.]
MEIELKLALEAAGAPALRAHPLLAHYRLRPPRTATVENRYFDTPALDLWRRGGIELRLRRDGRRHLQTVKRLPDPQARGAGGLHRLDEWEAPLAGNALDLPAMLAAMPAGADDVVAALRTAAQARLAERVVTRYRRTTWLLRSALGDEVELVLDVGEVRAGTSSLPLCEVELELKAGHERALFELASALQAGAPGHGIAGLPLRPDARGKAARGFALLAGEALPPPRVARRIPLPRRAGSLQALRLLVDECLAHVQANEAGVLQTDEPEYVHQMRVGLRRLRAALGLFKAIAPAPPAVLEDLRWSAERLGVARDAEVLATETLARIPPPPPSARMPWQPLREAAQANAARARREAIEAVRSSRHVGWQLALLAWVSQLEAAEPAGRGRRGKPGLHTAAPVGGVSSPASGHPALGVHARAMLKRLRRRLVRRGRELPRSAATARHEARIAAKKLRYATEMLGPTVPGWGARRRVRALAALQEQLGVLNDTDVASAALAGLAAEDATLAPAVAYAQGWLSADAGPRIDRLGPLWRQARRAL